MPSGKYVTKETKVIMLSEGLQDFLVMHKRQYEYDGPNTTKTTPIIEAQLVVSEVNAETDLGFTYIPAKTLWLNEGGLKKLYQGLKEIFEKEED